MVAERSRRNETVVAQCGHAKYGLVRGQAYTVIAAISIEGDGRAPRNMIKLRNPLFKGTYTGPWHEDDGRWTNAYKVAAGYTKAEDNFFFMPLDDFTQIFRELTVVESANLAVAQSKTKSTGQKFSYSFQNPANQSEAIITLDYRTPRMYPAGCEKPDVQYTIALKDADGYVIEKGSVSLQYSYGYVQIQNLPKGVYQLEVLNLADPSALSEFTISVFSAEKVDFLDRIQLLQKDLDLALTETPYKIYNRTQSSSQIQS